MNINDISNYSNNYFMKIQKLKDKENTYDITNDSNKFSGMILATQNRQDSLSDKYLNITDSMSRDKRISFAASIIANKVIEDGINTSENKSFLQNISLSFTAEELNSLKNEIRNLTSNDNSSKVEDFIKQFDEFVNSQKQKNITKKDIRNKQDSINADMFYRISVLGI